MFCICAENCVDNTGMLPLLLSSAYTESRSFLLLIPSHQRVGWGCTRSWEAINPGQSTSADQRDIPYHMMSFSKKTKGEVGGAATQRLAGLRLFDGEQLFSLASLAFLGFCFSLFAIFLLITILLLLIFFFNY